MKYLLDGDPGHDDMLAILLAVRHLEVVGVTTTHGNTSVDNATRNALQWVDFLGRPDIRVARGRAHPLLNSPVDSSVGNGSSGAAGAVLPEATTETYMSDAIAFLLGASHRYHSDLAIIATGPLTNIASALLADPSLGERIQEISLMGGSLAGGNSTAAAEFNIWADPEAAAVVFASGIPLRMFGLNVTERAGVTSSHIQRIREIGSDLAIVVADILQHVRIARRQVFAVDDAPLHDPLAVATFIDPGIFTLRDMRVDIELHGNHTRGMTVVDARSLTGSTDSPSLNRAVAPMRAANCQVAVDVDVDAFFDLLIDSIRTYDVHAIRAAAGAGEDHDS
ncbi:nucleoside hydrolase [Microbacterium sp. BR1]|uniref:nucleoside hydrolase n=1 Tax=Microbacterium sp. BR1 TaxID=1070896 RepID=UPI0012FD47AB|nr:nucleoside hydrolase [Microbacterium sp. BR1]